MPKEPGEKHEFDDVRDGTQNAIEAESEQPIARVSEEPPSKKGLLQGDAPLGLDRTLLKPTCDPLQGRHTYARADGTLSIGVAEGLPLISRKNSTLHEKDGSSCTLTSGVETWILAVNMRALQHALRLHDR